MAGRAQAALLPQLVLGLGLLLQLACAQVTQVQDVVALTAFKKSLANPIMLKNWIGDPCVGKWMGIKCGDIKGDDGSITGHFVYVLWLPELQLVGSVPEEIGSMPHLSWIGLYNNSLSGKLPANLGSNSKINYMDFSNNQLEGEFHFDSRSPMTDLNLAGNQFSGEIPSELLSVKSLKTLILSRNQFSGSIPEELASLQKLRKLELDNNQLTGGVPAKLAELPDLASLKLQNNNLDGTVPEALAAKQYAVFYGNPNLCLQTRAGECRAFPAPPPPPAVTPRDGTACPAGATRICYCSNGQQGSQTCESGHRYSACSCGAYTMTRTEPSSALEWYIILLITLGSLMAVLIGLCAGISVYRWRQSASRRQGPGWEKHPGKRSTAAMDAPQLARGPKRFEEEPDMDMYTAPPMKSIRALAPDDRPTPPRKPTAMSIGRSWGKSMTSSSREFYGEMDAPDPSAPNLGSEGQSWPGTPSIPRDLQMLSFQQIRNATNNFDMENVLGSDGVARVYRAILPDGTLAVVKELEFMANSQLSPDEFADEVVAIFRELEHRNLVRAIGFCAEEDSRLMVFEYIPNASVDLHLHGQDNQFVLDWNTRMHIVLGTARGLEFLHDQEPPIIHQEMRATNVLLDTNFDAKLSDYALGAITGRSGISQNSASANMAVAAGTAAPELAWAQEYTPETDVYAFGVLLLEVVTGRRPLDPKLPPNEQALVRWARPRLTERNRVESLVDWKLGGEYSSPALYQVALLAWQCIQVDPAARPNMAQIVEVLQKVQNLAMDVVPAEQEEEQRLHDFLSVNVAETPSAAEAATASQWADPQVAIQVEEESEGRSSGGIVRPPSQWPAHPQRQSQYGRSMAQPLSPTPPVEGGPHN